MNCEHTRYWFDYTSYYYIVYNMPYDNKELSGTEQLNCETDQSVKLNFHSKNLSFREIDFTTMFMLLHQHFI